MMIPNLTRQDSMTEQSESFKGRWVRAARDNMTYVALLCAYLLLLILVDNLMPALFLPTGIVFALPFLAFRVKQNGFKGFATIVSWIAFISQIVAIYIVHFSHLTERCKIC